MTKPIHIKAPTKEELTKKGNLVKIKTADGLNAKTLRNYGFTNHNPSRFYYMIMLGDNISFNVTIDKDTLSTVEIEVLDERFLQPFDYQHMIMSGTYSPFIASLYEKVELEMEKLQQANILTGHVRGEYI